QLKEIEVSKTTKECMGEEARMQKISLDKQINTLWEIQMLRLREKSMLSGIANQKGDFTVFNLGDGQYIGESTTLIYDSNENILIMQRNRNAITPAGMEEYLNNIVKEKNIMLKPIIEKEKNIS